ncbi:hypothetical protein [Thalassotalea aquiviva]|uniref:hypothetical protein n=1 Tax=Thalassotalea aquiviva TaxID=3242415 RepID=UPI00352A3185
MSIQPRKAGKITLYNQSGIGILHINKSFEVTAKVLTRNGEVEFKPSEIKAKPQAKAIENENDPLI